MCRKPPLAVTTDKFGLDSPDTQVGNEGAAAEEARPDVVHHDGLDTPVAVEHGQGAKQGVSQGSGVQEGEDHCGNLTARTGHLRYYDYGKFIDFINVPPGRY